MTGNVIMGEQDSDRTYQPLSEIVLRDARDHTYVIEAYCIDFHKDVPTRDHHFSVSAPDPRLAELLMRAKLSLPDTLPRGSAQKIVQSAIWMQSDGVSDSQLQKRFPVSNDELKLARNLQALARPVANTSKYASASAAELETWANAGDTKAQTRLATRYFDGTGGCKRDKVAAYKWALVASEGDFDARMLVGQFALFMSKDEIRTAKALAEKTLKKEQ